MTAKILDWLNVPLHERIDARRIDVLLLVLGLFCAGYYGYLYGWIGALKGGVTFVAMLLIAFVLRELWT